MDRHSVSAALAALGLLNSAQPAMADCKLLKFAEFPVVMTDAVPLLTAKVNGADTTLIADTGAFFSILTPTSAKRLGLSTHFAPDVWVVGGATGASRVPLATAKT